eukprot:COSAG06_NODE_770_length_12437_cov_27.452423_1_plen_77_part_10
MSDLGISGTKQTASRGPDLVWHFSMSFVSETFESSFHGPPAHHAPTRHSNTHHCLCFLPPPPPPPPPPPAPPPPPSP